MLYTTFQTVDPINGFRIFIFDAKVLRRLFDGNVLVHQVDQLHPLFVSDTVVRAFVGARIGTR